MVETGSWRFMLYREAAGLLHEFCRHYLSGYCSDCRRVVARLPEARDEDFELVSGIYPGCCHRGAGDIFRLEGQSPGRDRLAPEIVAGLEVEREKILAGSEVDAAGDFVIRRLRDGELVRGAHCRYFSLQGCRLGDLKGPLCLDFICPPIRADLLALCGGDAGLVGPENDFLYTYRLFAVISYDPPGVGRAEFETFCNRLHVLEMHCRNFLKQHQVATLREYFNPAATTDN